jgi:methionyl-tRNA formyltransferase
MRLEVTAGPEIEQLFGLGALAQLLVASVPPGAAMKIAFFGLPLGAYLLGLDGHDLRLIVLAPIAAPGERRVRRLTGPGRVVGAAELGDALEAEVERRLPACGAEIIVSWYWTRRIPERWLAQVPRGGIGVHPSLLPRHRGPDPFFWAIDAGDSLTGVTVHRLVERYDAGEILDQASLRIGDRDAWQLARALDRPSLARLRHVLGRLGRGEPLSGVHQDESARTLAPEPSGAELRVDWRWPTDRVLRRVRALAPVPGLALEVAGVPLFVTRAGATTRFPAALLPGEAAWNASGLVIRTGDGAIQVERAVLGEGSVEAGREFDVAGLAAFVASRGGEMIDSASPTFGGLA